MNKRIRSFVHLLSLDCPTKYDKYLWIFIKDKDVPKVRISIRNDRVRFKISMELRSISCFLFFLAASYLCRGTSSNKKARKWGARRTKERVQHNAHRISHQMKVAHAGKWGAEEQRIERSTTCTELSIKWKFCLQESGGQKNRRKRTTTHTESAIERKWHLQESEGPEELRKSNRSGACRKVSGRKNRAHCDTHRISH